MTNLNPYRQKNPNPQGKGCVSILRDWDIFRPQMALKKSPKDILTDYCLSALVLGAKFHFRPVPGKLYYLYGRAEGWNLSLISPGEWGAHIPGEFVAQCRLRGDMTWQLEFSQLTPGSAVLRRLEEFIDNFGSTLAAQQSITDELPFYVETLPYYQRLLATGLAASLQHSISETDVTALIHGLPNITYLRRITS